MATYVSVFRTASSYLTPPYNWQIPVKSHLLVDELNLSLYCLDFPFIVKLADFRRFGHHYSRRFTRARGVLDKSFNLIIFQRDS